MIIIDEVSMVSAELLGALQYVVTKAIRVRGTYKKRRNGTTCSFAGVHLVMCGDFWQLHPVSGIFLAADFTVISPGRAANALNLFWAESIRDFWELIELMQCDDTWYNASAPCNTNSFLISDFVARPFQAHRRYKRELAIWAFGLE